MKFVSWNLLPTPFRLCRFQYFQYLRKFNFYVSTRNTLFGKICFRPEIPFLGKFGPKKSKLLVQTEIWFLDWYEFSGFKRQCWLFQFRPEMSFLGKFGSKNQNYQFKLKFDTYTNWNMQNSVVLFYLSVSTSKFFCPKITFAILVLPD